MVARAARSLQSLPTIGIACETRGTRRSLRVSRRRFQLSIWMLEFICGSRAIRKKNDGNDGTIEISRYRACSHLHLSRETLLSLPCLFFHSLGLFDRCYLSTRKENEYAFSRKRVLEILMYATRRKGQEKVVSSIFNYIEPS